MGVDRRTCLATGLGLIAAGLVLPASSWAAPTRKIALLFDSLISPFWLASIESMRAEAARRGWTVLEAVSNTDDNRQYQQVQSMIQRGVDGIVMVHTDDKAVIPAIRACNRANVPLVHFNRPPAPNDAYSVAVVADNRAIMRATVLALIAKARRLGGKYQAAILVGDLGDANGVHRREGFQDAVEHNGDVVEVVARIATEWNADKAYAGLSNALQAHPDINLIVTSSDFLTPQIEQALRTAGKWHRDGEPGHVLIAGFDGDPGGYAQLEAGYYDVDGVQNLDYEVALTFASLEQMWAGQKPDKVLTDPGFVITRENRLETRDQMWGYQVWKAQTATAAGAVGCAPGAGTAANGAGAVPAGTGAGLPSTGVVASSAATGACGAAALSSAGASGATGISAAAGAASTWSWAALALAFTGFVHAFASADTAHDVLLAMLPLAILVVGQTLVMLVGQIDLSMTAVMALGSVIGAAVMTRHNSGLHEMGATLSGVLVSLAVGAGIGLFNGACTAFLRMPSFIVTLAVMMFGGGAAVWYASTVSDTISIGGLPATFRAMGYGTVAGIPLALIAGLLILSGAWYLLTRTVSGRWIYAVGHNPRTAQVSGVPVQRVTLAVFVASGLCAAVASIIYTARIETGLPTLGQNLLLDIVGAAVIGGVSLFGGRGNVLMALGGVLFLCLLDKTLQLLGLSLFLVLAIKGLAILVAAVLDVARQKRRARA